MKKAMQVMKNSYKRVKRSYESYEKKSCKEL